MAALGGRGLAAGLIDAGAAFPGVFSGAAVPATVFLISGIFALVPGAGIYYTAYYFIMGDNAMAVAKGVETFKIAVALAVGIVLVLALPGRLFEAFAPCAGKKKGER